MKISLSAFVMAGAASVGICVVGAAIGSFTQLSAGARAENFPPLEHPRNEASASVNLLTGDTLIDVNDSFLVRKEPPKGLKYRVSFAVLDGTRSIYGSCESGHTPKSGEPSTTWLTLEHAEYVEGNPIYIELSRTIDFDETTRVYKFNLPGDGRGLVLDNGVFINMSTGNMIYTQQGGLIGPNGLNFLQITYDIRNSHDSLTGTVTLDDDSWTFQAAKNGSRIAVNNVSITNAYNALASFSSPVVAPLHFGSAIPVPSLKGGRSTGVTATEYAGAQYCVPRDCHGIIYMPCAPGGCLCYILRGRFKIPQRGQKKVRRGLGFQA